MSINSTWINFKTKNPIKIGFKEEENLFEKITFNENFWKNFDLQK